MISNLFSRVFILIAFFLSISVAKKILSLDWINQHGKFSITYTPKGYKVFISLASKCDISLRERLFNRTALRVLNEKKIGPDEILVQLEGDSIQTYIADSRDFCSDYYTVFQIPVSGLYKLKIIHTRRDYNSVREGAFASDPEYRLLLDKNLGNELDYYVPKGCQAGYWVAEDALELREYFSPNAFEIRDECTSVNATRNMKIHTNVIMDPKALKQGCASDVRNFRWNRKVCELGINYNPELPGQAEAVAYNHPNISFSKNNWFRGKKIIFVGDSHTKKLADSFFTNVCKVNGIIKRKIDNDFWGNVQSVSLKSGNTVPYFEYSFTQQKRSIFQRNIEKCKRKNTNIEKCDLWIEAKRIGYADESIRLIEDCFNQPNSITCRIFSEGI